jgi:hypothetical protein
MGMVLSITTFGDSVECGPAVIRNENGPLVVIRAVLNIHNHVSQKTKEPVLIY